MTHGAWSARKVAPLAAGHKQRILDTPNGPPYLRDELFSDAVDALAWVLGQIDLVRAWIDGHDLEEGISEREEHEEREESGKGSVTRRGSSRRVQSAYDLLHRLESRARALRADLGLTPASQARISRDLSQSRWYAGQPRPLDIALAKMAAEREAAAIEAGPDET
jgi:hypothetical protein